MKRSVFVISLVFIAGCLSACEGPDAGPDAEIYSATSEPAVEPSATERFDSALAALKSGSAGEKSLAAHKLGTSGDARAIAPLADALSDPDVNVRMACVVALADLERLSFPGRKMNAAAPAVARAANDSDDGVRHEAAKLLEKIK